MRELPHDVFESVYGAWAPRSASDAAALFRGLDVLWWVVGGQAIEAFTGVVRSHEDLDLEISRSDLPALRRHLAGRRHVWAAWHGGIHPIMAEDPDELPQGCGQVWLRKDSRCPWEIDVLMNPGADGEWVNRRLPTMSMTVDEATWTDLAGTRFVQPEIVLLFKARHRRARDEADFAATLPLLSVTRRDWLRVALEQVHPHHDWLDRLGAEATG